MFRFIVIFLCAIQTCFCIIPSHQETKANLHILEPGSFVEVAPKQASFGISRPNFNIFCYKGRPKYIIHLFQTTELQIDIEVDDFIQYHGCTPEDVKTEYENKRSFFSLNFLTNKKKIIKMNPFNQSCIGIETNQSYNIHLNLIRIDFYKVIMILVGLFIFFSAHNLSENSLFYYICGILLGVFASFLVIVYLGSKLFPRRPVMYGVMIGGWTLGIYFAQMLWENIQMILVTYHTYVFWYVIATGFISFVICYRLGPPENQRSKNLIKWGLQLSSLIIIFYSSDFQEATVGIDVLALILYYFPKQFITKGRGFWIKKFPPKRKLLTNEEYYEEGCRETTKALNELRTYCSSPECRQWSTMRKLKNPQRFASFIEGDSHLQDEEILEYEVSQNISDEEVISDEEDDGEIIEEEAVRQPTVNHNNSGRSSNRNISYNKTRYNSHSNGSTRKTKFIYRGNDGVEISDDE